jgi:hypothetical protein
MSRRALLATMLTANQHDIARITGESPPCRSSV